MKKIIFFSFIILQSVQLFGNTVERRKRDFTAFSAGYVFKNDCAFKDVYGHGMINAITADFCYYPWKHWGFGGKLSYWRAKGHTTFLEQCTLAQEVPVTLYLRAMKEFQCRLQLYGSLGGGFAWIKEKSYLGNVHTYKGIGELEVGLNYPLWRYINVVGAARYIFPPQKQSGDTIDVGGVDLRAGIGFVF